MIINLNDKIADNLKRLENLAEEAAEDEDQSFSSRASAMSATTSMLKELTRIQETVVNMERLMRIEKITIETVKQYLTQSQQDEFLTKLEEILNENSSL